MIAKTVQQCMYYGNVREPLGLASQRAGKGSGRKPGGGPGKPNGKEILLRGAIKSCC